VAAWTAVRGVDHRYLSFSDGVYTYIASVVAAHGGRALYGSTVLSQPPGVVLGAGWLWRRSPSVETLRLALAGTTAVTILLTYTLARANRLSRPAASFAGLVALTAPIHAELSGLDGEVVLAPLAVAAALLAQRRQWVWAGALVGAGFFFKATWAPFAIAALVVAGRAGGRGAAVKTVCASIATASVLWLAAILRFSWSGSDLWSELIRGQSHTGAQIGLFVPLVAVTMAMWWPFAPPVLAGRRSLDLASRAFLVAALAGGIFMLKQGTFFNVLDPAEPFVAVAAAAGIVELRRRGSRRATAVLAVCTLGLALHVASVVNSATARVLPLPIGGVFLDTDNQKAVEQAVQVIDRNSRPDQRVLVNPFLAVLAQRTEVDDQADWFILHGLGRSCAKPPPVTCRLWKQMKAAARNREAAVVGVDANVKAFDPAFSRDTGISSLRQVLRIDKPPLDVTLLVRR
jgi:hypothetical protein